MSLFFEKVNLENAGVSLDKRRKDKQKKNDPRTRFFLPPLFFDSSFIPFIDLYPVHFEASVQQTGAFFLKLFEIIRKFEFVSPSWICGPQLRGSCPEVY
jgi:hypothetical protein